MLLSCCVSERTDNPLHITNQLLIHRITDSYTTMSLCRQNYHEESEAGVNKQINLELYASYVYQSMVSKVVVSGYSLTQSLSERFFNLFK